MNHSINTILRQLNQQFQGLESPRLEAELLVGFVLDKPRIFLHIYPELPLTAAQHTQLKLCVKRRLNGEPLAYIMNKKEFWSMSFKVTPDVLIPRFETELLVEKCLEILPANQNLSIADLGTGSGAIALALAKERPNWQVIATDQSNAALNIARENAQILQIKNIEFHQGDWCAALPKQKFEAIISNPPYIDKDDPELEAAVKQYEPNSALLATDNGLADLKIIAEQAKDYLEVDGWLLLEHGHRQVEVVAEYLRELNYKQVQTFLDLAGLPRVTVGRFSE
jgi:release factor glutamine methyltransferase